MYKRYSFSTIRLAVGEIEETLSDMGCLHGYSEECKRCARLRALKPVKCRVCGTEIVKKDYESIPRYLLRVACSDTCNKEYLKKHGKAWFTRL